jgi:hypothetical protein
MQMVSPQSLVFILIGASIALIFPFLVRPSITISREGKMLAFIAFFIFPVLAAGIGASEHFEADSVLSFLPHHGAMGKKPVCGRPIPYSCGAFPESQNPCG